MSNPYSISPKSTNTTSTLNESLTLNRRGQLQRILEDILGSRNVYYQAPTGTMIQYPAIMYSLNTIRKWSADNGVYNLAKSYTVIVVSPEPDSAAIEKILERIPHSEYSRHYVSDNMHHDVITIFF